MLHIFLLWLYIFLHRLLLPGFNIFLKMLYIFLLWLYISCIGSSFLGSTYSGVCSTCSCSGSTIYILA
jgi:hypothetical protein